MKFRLLTFVLYFFIALILCLPFLLWHFKPSTSFQVVVVDKTVPQPDYREHLGLFWVLRHQKIINKETDELFEKQTDFYGYHPNRQEGDEVLEIEGEPDLIYVADTYGVYEADLDGNVTGERSNFIYGGLTFFEWNRLMAAKSKDTTLIVEFNTMQSPTSETVRSIVERNLSLRWTGWIGRYFPDLSDTEVPVWLKNNYEKQTNKEWTFQGPGMAFVDESDDVVVLEKDDIKGPVQFSWTEKGKEHYKENSDSEYTYWFDIVKPDEKMETEGIYTLMLTESGEEELKRYGIPTSFPAVLKHKEEPTYYFAGDFADIRQNHWAKWVLPKPFYSIMAMINQNEQFFWEVYIPLMEQILDEMDQKKRAETR